jgi:P27 family predicted phage terminase small subunit
MGTRGRKPKPTAIKELAGNPGKRPLNKQEPKPGQPDLRVPRGKLPRDGQRLWRVIAPMLDRLGVLTEADVPALEMLCLHYAVVRMAWEELERDGSVVAEGVMGGIKKHPAVSVLRENSLAFRAYLTEFGMTPSSRVRVKAGDGEKDKSLAELLFEGIEGET